MRHTSVCSRASERGARGAGSPDPRHHLQASGFPCPRSGQSPRKVPPEPSALAEPEGRNPLSLDFHFLPQVSEVDFPSAGTAGPHSCGSSNRGTREARGRWRDCLMQPVSPGLCHFKTQTESQDADRRLELSTQREERGQPGTPPRPARERHVGPGENRRLQRDPGGPWPSPFSI